MFCFGIVVAVASAILPGVARAWGDPSHRAIAAIAERCDGDAWDAEIVDYP
jgi:hypothetical protein